MTRKYTKQEWLRAIAREREIAALERDLDRIVTKPEVRVNEDYDAYTCGDFSACVSADADGGFEAEFFGFDKGSLAVADLRHLKALCEALLKRSQDTDNPPICQAIRRQQSPQRVRTFGELFKALEKRVEAHGCTPDLLYVRAICEENGLNADKVVPFLQQHGGGCECEILRNAADKFDADKRLPVSPF